MGQAITPELKQWVQAQLAAGYTAEVLAQSMCQVGWTAESARLAIDAVRLAARHGVAPPSLVPAAPAWPQPDLSGAPRQLDAGDRWVDVLLTLRQPQLVVLGNVLSPQECEALIRAAEPRMKRSLTVHTATGGEQLNEDRTSQGMFFQRGETDVVRRLEQRLAHLLRWPVENGEGLQVLRYPPGAEYKPHYDYFDPAEPGTARILQRGGQRVATVVVYLNEPARGGGTVFPDVGLEVCPKQGHAVYFAYDRPHPGTRTLHGGAPVQEGEKWVATKWLRERSFY